MLKYLQNYCLRSGPRARPQNIDGSANKMVLFANRPYIDTYLFVINIGYLLRRLGKAALTRAVDYGHFSRSVSFVQLRRPILF
jgi:hypothetical protein